MKKIKVYEDEERQKIVGFVKYNNILDYLVGTNSQNGGVGEHLGITKLKNNKFVLIFGTDWQNREDYAYVVSNKEALKEIIKSGNEDLLKQTKFKELKELKERSL